MNEVRIPVGPATLDGDLTILDSAMALVIFVHGSGSSRHSPRNQFVARRLNDAKLATLLFDLLTPDEELVDMRTAELRFDIGLLAERLVHATNWAKRQKQTRDLPGDALPKVKAPTLLIVGGGDEVVIELNEKARAQMRCEVKLEIVPGATHLFEEPGALEQVAKLTSDWFLLHAAGKAGPH
jgi:putative phosphoribosyl transferase